MKDINGESVGMGSIELGYLAGDISFMTRVLYSHVRQVNAELHREWDTITGTLALISLIGLNPGISQNDLAAAMVMKKSAVTKIIGDLESRGLVIREKPKADRRMNALSLSPDGEEVWENIRARASAQQEYLLQPLNLRDRERLFALLGRLISHYANHGGTSGPARSAG